MMVLMVMMQVLQLLLSLQFWAPRQLVQEFIMVLEDGSLEGNKSWMQKMKVMEMVMEAMTIIIINQMSHSIKTTRALMNS